MPIYALEGREPRFEDRSTNWIAPDAAIIGDVRIGRNVSIWFGAVLRGDNDPIEIGENSNIQDNAVLHTDDGFPLLIGQGCTIGHKVMLHGCTLADNTLVGMGSTVLNGALISKNSLVGANALITEGKTFPEGSLIVGSPARAVRPLTEEQVEGLRLSSARYVRNGQRFRAGLREITESR